MGATTGATSCVMRDRQRATARAAGIVFSRGAYVIGLGCNAKEAAYGRRETAPGDTGYGILNEANV